jgi:quinol monooxygenase YgiN
MLVIRRRDSFSVKFLGLLSEVAETTAANELSCRAYAWFRSAEENEVIPHHWVQGFEVYDQLEASTVTHRASDPYNAFRQACAAESLLDRGSDLRYLEPLGIGFLARQAAPDSPQGHCDGEGYVVIERLKAAGVVEGRSSLLDLLRRLESISVRDLDKSTVASFWVLGYRPEDCDSTIVVFQRFATKVAFQDDFWQTTGCRP